MHPIDEAIMTRTLTRDMVTAAAAQPIPSMGHSYWGDAWRECGDPVRAVRIAARQMGQGLASIAAVLR